MFDQELKYEILKYGISSELQVHITKEYNAYDFSWYDRNQGINEMYLSAKPIILRLNSEYFLRGGLTPKEFQFCQKVLQKLADSYPSHFDSIPEIAWRVVDNKKR